MRRIRFTDDWTFEQQDGGKKQVDLPHDAMQEAGRSPKAASGKNGAFYKSGYYIYTKKFIAPEEWEGQEVELEFEGVYPNATVYLNDQKVGACQYGYSLFTVNLSGLRIGEENVIRVEVDDTKHPNSRWYAGAGMYRPVWLLAASKKHIAAYGVRITTESYAPARISIETKTVGTTGQERIALEIYDDKTQVAKASGGHVVIEIPDAKLWDAEHPHLYQCRVQLLDGDLLLDETWEYFGIRQLEWNAKKGFLVNGRTTLLKGGCIHHDNGILGARNFAQSEWRRIAKLKSFGYNAIRSAHNPVSRATLEACDALGMYVMDESWDTWYQAKNPYDCSVGFNERYETDLVQMVDKDYNHPSVIMYSIGNELTEPAKKEGIQVEKKLVQHLKTLDATRPVTAGINITLLLLAKLPFDPMAAYAGGGESEEEEGKNEAAQKTGKMSSEQYNAMMQRAGGGMNRVNQGFLGDLVSKKVMQPLDIAGYNYGVNRYEKDGQKYKNRVIVGTETYCQEIGKVWPKVEKLPHLVGDFMWTAWDYLGEAGIGGYSYDEEDFTFDKQYPWKLSDAGAIDILGNDTAEAGLAKVVFEKQLKPYIGVTPANHEGREVARAVWRGSNARPHWSYQACDGASVTVEVYSAAAEVELFVGDQSMGRQKLEDFQASYHTIYKSGTIRALAYDMDGKLMGESTLISASGKTKLLIQVEEDAMQKILPSMTASKEADRIVYLDIALVGENGQIECNADQLLEVSVDGGELLAFGSANPKTEDDYLSGRYHTYYGQAQAVVRLRRDAQSVKISVSGEKIKPVVLALPV